MIHAPEIKKVPALRRRGVEEATCELVAIIEEHCSANSDWLRQAVAAHSIGDYGAVGGPIVDYSYDRLRDWVVYFCEYNGALPPVLKGETAHLNDANIAYRRQLLIDHVHLLDDGYWPMTLHATLLAEGTKFLSVPEMVVYHRGPFDFGYYLRQRYLFSRAFAGVRAANAIQYSALGLFSGSTAHACDVTGTHGPERLEETLPGAAIYPHSAPYDHSACRSCSRGMGRMPSRTGGCPLEG